VTDRFAPTPRTRPNRLKERVLDDVATVHAVLDAAALCHVGFVGPDGPVVLPTLHARVGDEVYLHGSTGSWLGRLAADPRQICLTATCLDALVLARSAFHHSVNYRSATVFGVPRLVTDRDEKLSCLAALVDRMSPGRSAQAREPNAKEPAATAVRAQHLAEASATVRAHGVKDADEDLAHPVWAGLVPVRLTLGTPVPDGPPLAALPDEALAPPWAVRAPDLPRRPAPSGG
jgi:nitroimidazol reductase NimA-like FMN-containing flavoprotein (pyridoxamine 5'-phosphate oxidase superfamily)